MRRLALAVAVLAVAAPSAQALTLHGKASVYANDPVLGLVDHGDNNMPALAGATNDKPGIAVYNYSTLGRWWRVCSPWRVCRWVRQTDIGPHPDTGRVLDVNQTASRVLWRVPGYAFPTDVGVWRLTVHGRELWGANLMQARWERCASRACRTKWAVSR